MTKTLAKDASFRIGGFFSLGTPFRGTPVADLGYAIRAGARRFLPGGAEEIVAQRLQANALAVSLAVLFGQAPHGAALEDQRFQLEPESRAWTSRMIPRSAWNEFFRAQGHYHSLAGDADVNGNEKIEGQEVKVLAPAWVGFFFNPTSRLLATASEDLVLQPVANWQLNVPGRANDLPPWLMVGGTAYAGWMPNDLVTPYRSALPPELDDSFRVAYRPIGSHFAERRQKRGINPPDLNAGNHSMLKNPMVVDGVLKELISTYQPFRIH